MLNQQQIAGIVSSAKNEQLGALHIIYHNNPMGFIMALRARGLTNLTRPNDIEIDKVLRRLITRRDFQTIIEVAHATPFNPNNPASGDPNLWAALGVPYGDFASLVNMYVR